MAKHLRVSTTSTPASSITSQSLLDINDMTSVLSHTPVHTIASTLFDYLSPNDFNVLMSRLQQVTSSVNNNNNKKQGWSVLTSSLIVKICGYADDTTRLLGIERTCKSWHDVCVKSAWTSFDLTSILYTNDAMWCYAMGCQRLKTVQTLHLPNNIIPEALSTIVRHTPRVQRVTMGLLIGDTLERRVSATALSVLTIWTQLRSLKLTIRVNGSRIGGGIGTSGAGDCRRLLFPSLNVLKELHIDFYDNYDDREVGNVGTDDSIFELVLSSLPSLSTLEIESDDRLLTTVGDATSWDPNSTLHRVSIPHNLAYEKVSINWNQLLGRSVQYLEYLKTDDVTEEDVKLIAEMTTLRQLRLKQMRNNIHTATFWSPLSTLTNLTELEIKWMYNDPNAKPINIDFMTSMLKLRTIWVDDVTIGTLASILGLINRLDMIQYLQIDRLHTPTELYPLLSIDTFRRIMETRPGLDPYYNSYGCILSYKQGNWFWP